MMRWALCLIAVILVGCGGSPTSPSATPRPVQAPSPAPAPTQQPTPAPAPVPTFTGAVTDTVTGAPITGYTATLTGSRVTVAAPGYLTRDTRNGPAVDLIRNAAPFSLEFYRAFVRGTATYPGQMYPVYRQTQSFRVYIRTISESGRGIDPATLNIVRQSVTPALIEAFSGGRVALLGVDMGTETRVGIAGWITVRWPALPDDRCGQASLGGDVVELKDSAAACGWPWLGRAGGTSPGNVKHEFGHVMGFFHTGDDADVMSGRNRDYDNNPSARERYHAAIAYKRPVGSLDIDADPTSSTSGVSAPRMVID